MTMPAVSSKTRAPAAFSERARAPSTGAHNAAKRQTVYQFRCSASKDSQEFKSIEVGRRSILGAAAALALAAVSPSLLAVQAQTAEEHIPTVYEDGPDKFNISIPADWAAAEGQLETAKGFVGASGGRRALAWFVPGEERDTNVTVVITNIGADFTSLGSFGSAYAFGTNLVNSMDQRYMLRAPSWAQPKDKDIQVARLVDANSVNDSYIVEYTVANNKEGSKHLVSRVMLGYNGVYNRLYTVTAQCPEAEFGKYEKTLKQIISSFQPPELSVYRRV